MRFWGFWTRGKLDILRRYLNEFTTTTKYKATERIYIDAFAGGTQNRDRLTGEEIEGSALIALSTDNPPFTCLRFFETETQAADLDRLLRDRYPNRDLKVFGGDCNDLIPEELKRLQHLNWAPTFAFVDPNGPHTHWSTLQALASFKARGRTKTEIWLLFPAAMFIRMLPITGDVPTEYAEKLTKMYGNQQWRLIYEARVAKRMSPSFAREEYVNLMRWRLEKDLGYRWSHPFEVFNEQGNSIYHMIFSTDHIAGNRIMTSIYRQAAGEFPAMRNAARRHRERLREQEFGVVPLFGEEEILAATGRPFTTGTLYTYEPPWRPYGMGQS